MRPLPDLTDLEQQPSVFQQGTDDWNSIFANEFAGMTGEQAGADHVLCLMQVGRLEHREVMKSVELFGKYVIPEFKR